jgi:hypothetical protein
MTRVDLDPIRDDGESAEDLIKGDLLTVKGVSTAVDDDPALDYFNSQCLDQAAVPQPDLCRELIQFSQSAHEFRLCEHGFSGQG